MLGRARLASSLGDSHRRSSACIGGCQGSLSAEGLTPSPLIALSIYGP